MDLFFLDTKPQISLIGVGWNWTEAMGQLGAAMQLGGAAPFFGSFNYRVTAAVMDLHARGEGFSGMSFSFFLLNEGSCLEG